MAAKNPVKITDTTFRDGHQSTLATRLRLADMEPIAELLDSIGFHSLEVWGGATFDVAHRFLQEDPWERLRKLKKLMPKTPLQMLLRGQNLVGYRHYADDVVEAFCKHAVDCGMDIFRVFDALNDGRNFEAAFAALQKAGGHIQATISYTLTERKVGGPVFNLDYYRAKAKEFVGMGAHSLCLKDMAGLLSPDDASLLITELKKIVDVPIQLHTHYTSGMASMAYLKAIEAGVDVIDCALAPFALRSSQPASEPFVVALEGSDRDTGLDLAKMFKVGEYIESIAPKYRHFLNTSSMAVIDTNVLRHQIPGGMLSNLVNQLRQADALDKLDDVYRELPQTRKDLGYPPLVTPTSQIVGVQAVMNVLGGERYKLISKEVKDYCYGLYGAPPVEIDPAVRAKCLKGYERGETPITDRPANHIEPELAAAKEAVKDITDELGEVLIYALYPRTGLNYLRFKHGLEHDAPGEKAKTLEEVKREDALIKKAVAGELTDKASAADLANTRAYRVAVEGEVFDVLVETDGDVPELGALRTAYAPTTAAASVAAPKAPAAPAAAPSPAPIAGGTKIVAPMPGTIVRYAVNVGDAVKAGQTVVILEAMKMENALPAPCDGTIKALGAAAGATASRGDMLAVIG